MENNNMTSNSSESSPPAMIDERYKAALESHNHEFRTLGERASIFAVVQSILLGALVLILTNQPTGFRIYVPLLVFRSGLYWCSILSLAF